MAVVDEEKSFYAPILFFYRIGEITSQGKFIEKQKKNQNEFSLWVKKNLINEEKRVKLSLSSYGTKNDVFKWRATLSLLL